MKGLQQVLSRVEFTAVAITEALPAPCFTYLVGWQSTPTMEFP